MSVNFANKLIDSYLKAIETNIISGDRVTIPYIGSFKRTIRSSKKFRNISTGEHQVSPSHYGVKFTPKKSLIKLMNERNDIFQ